MDNEKKKNKSIECLLGYVHRRRSVFWSILFRLTVISTPVIVVIIGLILGIMTLDLTILAGILYVDLVLMFLPNTLRFCKEYDYLTDK